MAAYGLPEPAKRRVENALLAVGLGTVLAWLAVVVLPEAVVVSAPRPPGAPASVLATAAFSLPGYPAVAVVRAQFADDPAEGTTLERALWAASASAVLLAVGLLAYVLVVLSGPTPLP